MPTTTAVAPGRSTSHASRIVAGEPTASKAWSTPPGTTASTASTGSVAAAGGDGVRRPAAAGEGELGRVALDGHDAPGAGQPRRGHDLQPDAAAADDAHGVPRRDPRRVADGADRGHDAAAQQRRLPQRQPARQRHRGAGGHHAALREAGDEVEVLHRAAVRVMQARGAVHQRAGPRPGGGRLAQRQPPGPAGRACAARGDEAEGHGIAGRDMRDPLAHRLHHARPLVPQHDRVAPVAQVAVGQVQVGVADAGGGHAHQHLAGRRRVELQVAHLQGRAVGAEDGGADPHGRPPRPRRPRRRGGRRAAIRRGAPPARRGPA